MSRALIHQAYTIRGISGSLLLCGWMLGCGDSTSSLPSGPLGNGSGTGGSSSGGRASQAAGVTSAGGTQSTGGESAGVSGGSKASGGSSTSSGGKSTTGSGGAVATGGSSAAGGTGTGGSSTGGKATGGSSTTGTGGSATGGNATGGSATGGSSTTSTGGSATGGKAAGGSATGGSSTTGTGGSGTGGSAAGGSSGTGSPGCGSANPLQSGTFTISVGGTDRKYVLDVPTGYDANQKYRLIFVWHPLGGSATQVVNGGYDGLKSLSNGTAILVAPDGLTGTAAGINGQGWYNTNGGDIAFLRQMLDIFNQGLCIDQGKIFSTGFSFGGMFSYAIGCELSDVFRAIAPASGNLQGSGCNKTSTNPIAMLGIHGDNDTFVTTATGQTARDYFVTKNGCQTQTLPVDPSPCVEYQGCQAGYPTIWCEFPGGHAPWSNAPPTIWNFFSQF